MDQAFQSILTLICSVDGAELGDCDLYDARHSVHGDIGAPGKVRTKLRNTMANSHIDNVQLLGRLLDGMAEELIESGVDPEASIRLCGGRQ
jgi:hypothetical protein